MDGALWMYALLVLTSAPPYLPNSALIASAGVMVHAGELSLPLVLLTVAFGALVGDALIYLAGRTGRPRVVRWLSRSPRRQAALAWTGERMHAHGLPFVVGVRFLPSGRVIGGLTAALVDFPVRRYLLGMGVAQTVWASYSVALGYWGAAVLEGPLASVIVACGISLAVAGVARLVSGAGSRDAVAPTP
ncbi:DedA family protein [Streptomyces hainanensis]|uniref:DedA family protein n=1 Tax=Streptomyces hainanensis TaxID=402648 RepID=A0A4R4TCM2_9ACTN|nr:VTT domain-containing protein [Streptomyces hainanensis]TDC75248.1 DedA family protein [Streptomyces hainanensis]